MQFLSVRSMVRRVPEYWKIGSGGKTGNCSNCRIPAFRLYSGRNGRSDKGNVVSVEIIAVTDHNTRDILLTGNLRKLAAMARPGCCSQSADG